MQFRHHTAWCRFAFCKGTRFFLNENKNNPQKSTSGAITANKQVQQRHAAASPQRGRQCKGKRIQPHPRITT